MTTTLQPFPGPVDTPPQSVHYAPMKQSDKTQLRVLAMEAALRLSADNKTAPDVVKNAETIFGFISTEDAETAPTLAPSQATSEALNG